MWLYLAALVGLSYLLGLYLRDKYIFITGCDSGFGNLLARQLDLRGLRVLAACLTEEGAQQLRGQTSDRLETVILDVTKTESISAAAQWVKERVRDRVGKLLCRVCPQGLPSPCPSACLPCRRELSYFGVKVAMIEPGYFNTDVTNPEKISRATQEAWDRLSPEVKELYGEKFLASVKKSVEKLKLTCCNNLHLVTNCMEHALTACHPRTRYSPGWDAKLFYIPMSYMPTLLVDAMIYWSSPRPDKAL
ncbi:retinol dehydrogenase 16 [Leptonychotes weddellii]|uniref:Retinol dehydrogenase 16 n=1 Tax=Leptonychotes weddellii TaxID=9713 RepID=A0A7F8RHN5_LEPWE|nr:retinol dehydrogenase 16 [Leptonychotes weddellii]